MARQFLDTLRTQINNLLPDNSSGLITPAIVRTLMTDTVDSLVSDDATINRESATPAVLATQITPTQITGIADTAGVDTNMDGTSANAANGSFLSGAVAGRSYRLVMYATVELAINAQINLGVRVNGLLSGFTVQANGLGATKPISLVLFAAFGSQPAGATVECMAWTPDGVDNVTFNEFLAQYVIQPTNNP